MKKKLLLTSDRFAEQNRKFRERMLQLEEDAINQYSSKYQSETIDVEYEIVEPKQLPAIPDETDYLLSTEANRKRIEQGLKEAELIHQGKLKGKTFDEFLEEI